METGKTAVTIEFDENGDIISVQFAGQKPIYEPTHNVMRTPPDAEFVGSKTLGEMSFYRQRDGAITMCIHSPSCYLYCF